MVRHSSLNLRKKLQREGLLQQFDDQIQDAVVRRHMTWAVPTSQQLINYSSKPGSASTELRVISNSSINRWGGSLNENLVTGSNNMNSSLSVLLPPSYLVKKSTLSMDKDISPETRIFIQQGFYVNDGVASSMTTALDVYLCTKRHSLHIGAALSLDNIKDCIITARTVLRTSVGGSLVHLS